MDKIYLELTLERHRLFQHDPEVGIVHDEPLIMVEWKRKNTTLDKALQEIPSIREHKPYPDRIVVRDTSAQSLNPYVYMGLGEIIYDSMEG